MDRRRKQYSLVEGLWVPQQVFGVAEHVHSLMVGLCVIEEQYAVC